MIFGVFNMFCWVCWMCLVWFRLVMCCVCLLMWGRVMVLLWWLSSVCVRLDRLCGCV